MVYATGVVAAEVTDDEGDIFEEAINKSLECNKPKKHTPEPDPMDAFEKALDALDDVLPDNGDGDGDDS